MRARTFPVLAAVLTLMLALGCSGPTGTCVWTHANGDPDHCYEDETESFCGAYPREGSTKTFTADATCRDLGYDCPPSRPADAHMKCSDKYR
jgi:hypothetical protein